MPQAEDRRSPVERLLAAAGAAGASDLAFDPQDDGSLLAVARIDGVRAAIGNLSAREAATAIARLKGLAALPTYITDEPQDGRIDATPFAIPGDVRLSAIPTVRGQRLALRLPALGALPAPDGLGLPPPIIAGLRAALRRADGLVIVTGPTGSGKTTTIHSLLVELARERPDRQVLTIEDPVERRLPGVIQVETAVHRGFDHQAALAAALRQDPDVIVVGEVRDPATAAACLRAALTGHLVITTLHAGRAAEVVPRLVEMGCDLDLLAPALAGILAQRLVRLVHAPCAGAGCPGCHGGLRGRRAVADLALLDAHARAGLRRGEPPPLVGDLDAQAAALIEAGDLTAGEWKRVGGAG